MASAPLDTQTPITWHHEDDNCIAQRMMEHFEGALRGQRLVHTRVGGESSQTGATFNYVANLEKILTWEINLWNITGEVTFNSEKYQI